MSPQGTGNVPLGSARVAVDGGVAQGQMRGAGPESSSSTAQNDARWQCDDGVPAAPEASPSAHGLASCRPSPLLPELRSELPAVPVGCGVMTGIASPRDPPAQCGRGRVGGGQAGRTEISPGKGLMISRPCF